MPGKTVGRRASNANIQVGKQIIMHFDTHIPAAGFDNGYNRRDDP
jgi:hypothetical protein